MPRSGRIPVDIVPQTTGLRVDLPDHLVTPTSLPIYLQQAILSKTGSQVVGVGQLNTFVDTDGLIKPRQGYSNVGGTISLPSDPITGVLSSIGFHNQLVNPAFTQPLNLLAGSTNVYASVGNGTWQTIGPATTLINSGLDNPARMAAFASSGSIFAVGVSQGIVIQATGRNVGLSNALNGIFVVPFTQPGIPTPWQYSIQSTGFSNAADIEVLDNRVVVVNYGAGAQLEGVAWSESNDYTTWPGGNIALLNDGSPIDQLIAIRRTSQNTAVIYRERSLWGMYGVAGNDASAFGFERLQNCDNIIGPCSPNAVVQAGGNQYYMSWSGDIFQFNGSASQSLSPPIDALIDATMNQAYINRSYGFWIPNTYLLVFVYPFLGTTVPNVAVVYNLIKQEWEGFWAFSHPMSAGGLIVNHFAGQPPLGGAYTPLLVPDTSASITGQPQQFYSGDTSDVGSAIYAVYSTPLFRVDQLNAVLVDAFELYFRQAANSETIQVLLQGYRYPYDPAPATIYAATIDISNTSNFFQSLAPGTLAPNNIRANFLKLTITSNGTQGQLALGGGTIFTNPDLRGVYQGTQ